MIAIVDYGLGNLASVRNMLKKAGAPSEITRDPDLIMKADRVILPGVGAFGIGMSNLNSFGLVEVLKEKAKTGNPMLGICLGAQLMTAFSEENDCEGLNFFDARTSRFPNDGDLKVPHMGWSNITIEQTQHPLFAGVVVTPRYYFVHSYYMQAMRESDQLCGCQYGLTFAAGLAKDNLAGVQFHPEKSHVFGLQLMKNFIAWK
ncbi:MAG: imidazole glycerol phosphate synthase subunit HisH [Flavobacteriales bacterium]|nr:imidazole glycerol phosphate synthase subunit HisH [Flavobacteriales bacterium]